MSYEFIEYQDREMLVIDPGKSTGRRFAAGPVQRDRVGFAVPGGTSPGPVFDDLNTVDLDWSRVDVLLTDERWVPEDNPRSNTGLLRERLLINRAQAARYLPLYAPEAEPEGALDALQAPIAKELPLAVVLLGMGTDLHTASIFPGADRLEEALSPKAPVLLPMRAPGAPEPRITLSAPVLNGALSKHVLMFGEEKRAALENARGKPVAEAPINAVLSEARVHWAP